MWREKEWMTGTRTETQSRIFINNFEGIFMPFALNSSSRERKRGATIVVAEHKTNLDDGYYNQFSVTKMSVLEPKLDAYGSGL